MDPTIALYKEPILYNKNLLDQILRISPQTSAEERNNRITNAIQALSSTCFFSMELLTASSSVDRTWTAYIYGTDIITHLAQAYLSQNSNPFWKTTVLGLNILRLGSIWSTVTNVTDKYHPGKIASIAFHALDSISHGKNVAETTKMLWHDIKNPC